MTAGAVTLLGLIALAALPPESRFSVEGPAFDALLRAAGGLVFLVLGATALGATAGDGETIAERQPRRDEHSASSPGKAAASDYRRAKAVLAASMRPGPVGGATVATRNTRQPGISTQNLASGTGISGGNSRSGSAADIRSDLSTRVALRHSDRTDVRRQPSPAPKPSRMARGELERAVADLTVHGLGPAIGPDDRIANDNRGATSVTAAKLDAENAELRRRNEELFEQLLNATGRRPAFANKVRGQG